VLHGWLIIFRIIEVSLAAVFSIIFMVVVKGVLEIELC
jgi:hypothetical protein